MVLKPNGTGSMLLNLGKPNIGSGTIYPGIILHKDPIVNNGYKGVAAIGAI